MMQLNSDKYIALKCITRLLLLFLFIEWNSWPCIHYIDQIENIMVIFMRENVVDAI